MNTICTSTQNYCTKTPAKGLQSIATSKLAAQTLHQKQFSLQSTDYTDTEALNMLSTVQKFAKSMGLDLLLAIRDTYADEVMTFSTDPNGFTVKDAAKAKLVRKVSLLDEQESTQSMTDLVSDSKARLVDSISSRVSALSEAKTAANSPILSLLSSSGVSKSNVNGNLGSQLTSVNLASLMNLNDDDDDNSDEIERDNQSAAQPDNVSQTMIAPRLRRFISEGPDAPNQDLQLDKFASADEPHSALPLTLRNSEACNQDPADHSKYLAHTGKGLCCDHHFADQTRKLGRNLFAQKHLFKSGFQVEKQVDVFDTDEEASFEADLSDPASAVCSNLDYANIVNDDESMSDRQFAQTQHLAVEDEDQLDFMFLACADWENIAEDEASQDEDSKPKSANGPSRVVTFGSNVQLKREAKADIKPAASCQSFMDYCKSSDEVEWKEPEPRLAALDIDSMMKKFSPSNRKRKNSKNNSAAGLGQKRSSPSTSKNASPSGQKRAYQFSSAADLFKRTTLTKKDLC